ncbi:MAG: nucleoside monophosphate kinase, partial [Planctomycetes bacterium]|nr:nucleoside monophosphate kinase [Planctomycetota bacterium]
MSTDTDTAHRHVDTKPVDAVAIRFCGDSGDGMQLTGGLFTNTAALFGNDIATYPDFPAEIRAPRGTTFGVSGFQVQFASTDIFTPGDAVNALVAMNPAGFKTNIMDVEPGGIVIVNEDEFNKANFKKCGYEASYDPLDDDELNRRYQIVRVPMTRLTRESLTDAGMGAKDVDRCRNMYALGIVCWLYDRPLDPTIRFLDNFFGKKKDKPEVAAANIKALKAGFFFGETAELFPVRYQVARARLDPGKYRKISGNEATALGFVTAAAKANKQLVYASYPITPASEVLHTLSRLKRYGVTTFQAEDEISAVCAAIGVSFAGQLALTGTSGPGLALKGEGIGLAVMLEVPLVVIDVQRAGPSTGMPTKTEQADLLMALWGRPGESPCIVVAPRSPSDCFDMAIEAFRLAVRYMCPVIYLSDGYIANGAEPWLLPDLDAIEPIQIEHPRETNNPDGTFLPYKRDPKTLARPWAIPGTEGLEHRLGGLEKEADTGNVSYDPMNHEKMTILREEKIARIADDIPAAQPFGDESGDLLLVGWGGTYGALHAATLAARDKGLGVSHVHLRHLNPLPANLGEVLAAFKRVLVAELNRGQLDLLLRARYLIDTVKLNKMPAEELSEAIHVMTSLNRPGAVAAQKLGLRHLSTGDMLRRHVKDGTEIGKKVESTMKSGQLVPDELIVKMIADQIESMSSGGVMLDGFPRNLSQADKL